MRAQVTRYCDRHSAVLDDVQSRGEYLGGYRARACEDHHFLHIGAANSDEKLRGNKPRLKTLVMSSTFLHHLVLLCLVYTPLFLLLACYGITLESGYFFVIIFGPSN